MTYFRLPPFTFFLTLLLVLDAVMSLSAAITTGRVALVTGANKGIGKEICRLLAKDPSIEATVLACRSLERGQEAIRDLEKDGCKNMHCIEYDLSKPDSSVTVHDYVESNFGRLDILVNNAAICFNDPTLYGKVEHTPFEAQAAITVETNFFGTWRLTQALMPLLKKSAIEPRLINIASAAGRLAILKSDRLVKEFTRDDLTMDELEVLAKTFVREVETGTHAKNGWPNTCYGLSKLAIISMTKVLARLHPGMMCNTVDPGYCATDQNSNQGNRPAARGAKTPYLLATLPDDKEYTGLHWFDEKTIAW
jgi:carbonyl reductase 1